MRERRSLSRDGLELSPVHEVGGVGLADVLMGELQHARNRHEVLGTSPPALYMPRR